MSGSYVPAIALLTAFTLLSGCGSQVNQSAAAAGSATGSNPSPGTTPEGSSGGGGALELIADAGPDQVVYSGQLVALNGSRSRSNMGGVLSYRWQLVQGELVQGELGTLLGNQDRAEIAFLAPEVDAARVLTFELSVSQAGESARDQVEITILPVGDDPADADTGGAPRPGDETPPYTPSAPPAPGDTPSDGPSVPTPPLPLALPQAVIVERGRATTIALAGVSLTGTPLIFTTVTPTAHGSLSSIAQPSPLNFTTIRYTPAAGFLGNDRFTFTVSDGQAVSLAAEVQIQVVERRQPLPGYCTEVRFDEHQRFVVNGDRAFPFGYHGIFTPGPEEGWDEFAEGFNALTTATDSQPRNQAMQARGLMMVAQGTLEFDYSIPALPRIDASTTAAVANQRQIISWEVNHEPQVYPLDDIRGDVAAQAAALRAADPCLRPVTVIPSGGEAERFQVYSQSVDYVHLQHYPTPMIPLRSIGDYITYIRAWFGPLPYVYIYRVEGYQPGRYRLVHREPYITEIRAAMYDAFVHGSSGFFLFNYSRSPSDVGWYGFFEELPAVYNLHDSPGLLAAINATAREVRGNFPLLLGDRASDPVLSNNPDVRATLRDLNGALPGGQYLIAVNVGEDSSPYFEVISGGEILRPRAYVLSTDGRVFPRTACNNGIDDDGDGLIDLLDPDCMGVEDESESSTFATRQVRELPTNQIAVKRITPPVTDRMEWIDRVRLNILSAPANTSVRFAIYADDWRDEAPSAKIYESSWLPVGSTPAWIEAALTEPVGLEPARDYFLLFKVNRAGVYIDVQDVRYGARSKPGFNFFLDQFPPALLGRTAANVRLTPPGGPYSRYLVLRSPDQTSGEPGQLVGGEIVDTFEPYAVHIYQLLP